MRGAARAIGWELTRHHRLGLIVLAGYVLGFWVFRRLVFPEAALRFDPPNEIAGLFMAPLMIAFLFFVGAFSYGLSGDLGARESTFPRRMFVLPVRTSTLAGWPMLYGTLSSVSLWIVALLLAQASGGVKGAQLPWIWPGLAIAAFLAWMQALTWLSYPLRGMRIVVAILVLVVSDGTVVLAIELHASEATMVAILAPQVAVAYVIGYFALLRARRSDVPDWSTLIPALSRGRRSEFRSPARAQAWLEWRRHGRSLPAMALFVVPCELALLFLPGNDHAGLVFFILFVVLVTLPAMAMMAAPALAVFGTHSATRPMSSARLVAAKLEMTLWSTAAAWALTALFAAVALLWSGAMWVVFETLRDLEEIAGPLRATIVVLFLIAAFILSTWRNLVQSLCIGLTGRPWIIRSSVLAGLILVTFAFPILWLVVSNESVQRFVWDWLAWMLVALVWLKVSVGAWVAVRLHDRKVLGDRAIVTGVMSWLVAVAIVYGTLTWIMGSPIFPSYFLGAIAILLVPLARLSAAPLALAWSRHR